MTANQQRDEEIKLPYKNLVNEYCQRNRLTAKYQTIRAGGVDHQPLFRSTVYIGKKNATGEILTSKIAAEQSAAFKLLQQLQSTEPPLPSVSPNFNKNGLDQNISNSTNLPKVVQNTDADDKKTLVIVDLENQQNHIKDMEDFNCRKSDKTTFLVVYSRLCATKISSSVSSVIINSGYKDSADTGIIVIVTQYIISGQYETIDLVTRDHFGYALLDVLKQFYPELKYNIHVSFQEFLKNYPSPST